MQLAFLIQSVHFDMKLNFPPSLEFYQKALACHSPGRAKSNMTPPVPNQKKSHGDRIPFHLKGYVNETLFSDGEYSSIHFFVKRHGITFEEDTKEMCAALLQTKSQKGYELLDLSSNDTPLNSSCLELQN